MVGQDVFKLIKEAVDGIRIIDTHEHLKPEKERLSEPLDVMSTFFQHYASSDLISAGMSMEDLDTIRDPTLPLEERWARLEPFWNDIQNTSYVRALHIAARDLYSIHNINRDTYRELTERMRRANKEGLYRWVLKEKAKIDMVIQNTMTPEETLQADREFFAPSHRLDEYLLPQDRNDLEVLGRRSGRAIHTLHDLEQGLEEEIVRLRGSMVAVKVAVAYSRSLFFEKVTYAEAEKAFNKIYSQRTFRRVSLGRTEIITRRQAGISLEEARPFQDYMMHRIIQTAIKHNLPIQIHTGLQEGNENIISNSNPVHLVNLFLEYRNVKFDIFHGGYPYTSELAVLAKNFPNVYIDLCWLHVISPSAARRALSEWLDTVPSNKILGFGGDYKFIEGTYAHAVLARENIARVLAEKVEEGAFQQRQSIIIAKKILRDNAYQLFLTNL